MPTLVPIDDLVAVDVVGLAERLHDPLRPARRRPPAGRGRLARLRTRRRPCARSCRSLAHECAQPVGHGLQQLVAGRWPSVSLTFLKRSRSRRWLATISPGLTRASACSSRSSEQRPVGKVRQSVVQGHVRNSCLVAPQLGDVLVRGDPTAVRHRHVGNGEDASVAERMGTRRTLPPCHSGEPVVDVLLRRAAGVGAGGDAVAENLAQRCAGPHLLGRQAIHLGIPAVGDHEPLVGVEHAQPLRHVLQRGVQQHVLRAQLGGCGFTLVRLLEMKDGDRQSDGGQCGEEAESQLKALRANALQE